MDNDSFIIYTKTKGMYVDIAEDFETRFGTSNRELDGPLTINNKQMNWINERLIRGGNNDRVCCIETKNI